MKFLTFRAGGRAGAGMIFKERKIIDLGIAFFKQFRRPYKFHDLLDFLRSDGMDKVHELNLAKLKDERDCLYPLDAVELLAPLQRPTKIICVGLNYRDHASEQNKPVPEQPLLFMKAPNIVIGPERQIEIPAIAPEQVDFEVELAIVIGRGGKEIPRDQAAKHIFGYTVMIDVTARDLQQSDKQWFRAKSFDTFAPLGPYVVTPDEFNFKDAAIELRLNGAPMQSGRTKDMVFDAEYLIEYASKVFPLEPGDIISTGTPAGVGVFRNPPVFLKSGDEIEADIEGVGVLRSRVK